MKNRILVLLLLATIAILSFTSCADRYQAALKKESKTHFLYLVAGLDDAAENTDVIFTVGYDSDKHTMTVAQIPRDTYLNFGSSQNKLNQLYASAVSAGMDKNSAFAKFASGIERHFGVRFDGYLAIKLDGFKAVVERLGGLDIELSSDMTFSLDGENQIALKRGINHITAKEAEAFVRYRSGYALGDLGRIDAQKLFLNALFMKLSSGMSLPLIFDIINIIENDAISDISLSEVADLVMEATGNKIEKTILYATVPGEATQNNHGVSYYVLNRKSAAELAKRYMFAFRDFDPDRRFVDRSSIAFSNIYDDTDIGIREYTAQSLNDMKIIEKR